MNMVKLIALASACVPLVLASNASAENVTGTVTKAPGIPILKYQSKLASDGTLDIQLNENAVNLDPLKREVLTVFAPNIRNTEKMLHSQDWYMTIDSNGSLRGIYTVPRNKALPSSVLRSLGEGYGIMKVDPQNSFFKVFPSKFEIASQLKTFAKAAQNSVCDNPNKPESITASMDVKPGWSGAGRIKFDATWKTTDLCKKPKS